MKTTKAKKNNTTIESLEQKSLWSDFFTAPSGASVEVWVSRPERTIEWLGGVNFENLEKTLTRLKELLINDANDEVHLLVNSYGGPTGVGMSFYDTVRSWLRPKLVTIGSGYVDSSGIIVFLAGERRYLTKNTTLLFHLAGRTFEEGKRFSTRDMENMLKEDKVKDYQYACVVSDATSGKLSPEDVLKMMLDNTVITAEEAVNMGLAQKILE